MPDVRVPLRRTAALPDAQRVARCRRAPELGPRVLFFTGGSALRDLSHALKLYTHNSIHLVTPFDSGGSSAEIRKAFGMLSVGDLRNRMLSLADESVRGNPELRALFSHRLPPEGTNEDRWHVLESMVFGEHDLMRDVPDPLRRIVCTYLRFATDRLPQTFDLAGASIGNLVLAGGYLAYGRDIDSVLYLFSKLVEVRGIVRTVTGGDGHLSVQLEDGTRLVGQHLITGKSAPPIQSRVRELALVESLEEPRFVEIRAPDEIRKLIRSAELICFPMGSFYTSILANLLPRGVGRAIAEAECPKLYVPSMGLDPEQYGMTLADAVEALIDRVRADAGQDTPVERILDWVLVDRDRGDYTVPLESDRIKALGVELVDVPLVSAGRRAEDRERDDGAPARIDPQRLCEILLSLV